MAEILKLPIALFVSGMEVLARAIREYQEVANRSVDTTLETLGSGPLRPVDTGANASASEVMLSDGGEISTGNNINPQEKENGAMINEQALGSEDLKTVRYRIIFTKRNHETTLKEAETTVNYATDPMSLSGRYISDFFTLAGLGKERDALKRLYAAGYHEAEDPTVDPHEKISKKKAEDEQTYPKVAWTIKDEDKKYVAFRADLLDQLPRQKAEYDRQKVDELQKIRQILDDRLPPL